MKFKSTIQVTVKSQEDNEQQKRGCGINKPAFKLLYQKLKKPGTTFDTFGHWTHPNPGFSNMNPSMLIINHS
jgi:hypothetical protein